MIIRKSRKFSATGFLQSLLSSVVTGLASLNQIAGDLKDRDLAGMARQNHRTGNPVTPATNDLRIERSIPHGHVQAVIDTIKRLKLDHLITSKHCPERDHVIAMIASRILNPGSKLAITRALNSATRSNTLAEACGIENDIHENDLYAAMDWLLKRQPRIEKSLAARHLQDGSLILYDLTSSYFEGNTCPLGKLGYSRDGKKGKLQIVFCLLCDSRGCPIAVEVFDGNTADPSTVGKQIEKIRHRFGLKRVVLVGDRGMLTQARIDQELRPIEGLDWISALRSAQISSLVKSGTIQMELFDERNLAEISSPDFPGERLVVCRNPSLATRRAHKREALLTATEAELEKIRLAVNRVRSALRGKDKIGLRVGRKIDAHKMAKHFEIQITDDSLTWWRDEEKIREEAATDGLYVVRTSLPTGDLSASDIVERYKDLSAVENAFRSIKTVDLKVRPINHYSADRVRSHIFLCMLAYYVEWHMRQALKPLLFDEDDPQASRLARTDVVAAKKPSLSARAKAISKQTPEGLPVHNFQTLLDDPATLTELDKTIGKEFVIEVRRGDLVLRDMGYFSLGEFTAIELLEAWWLTRLPLTTGVMLADGRSLGKYLKSFRGDIIDLDVIVGEQGKKCRLVAMRAAPEVTAARRAQRRKKARECGKNPCPKGLIRDGWHLMLTNLSREQADVSQLAAIYRARWAEGIQFRAWKQALNLGKALNRKSNEHHLQALVLAGMIAHQLGMRIAQRIGHTVGRAMLSYEKLYDLLAVQLIKARNLDELDAFGPDRRHIERDKRIRKSPVESGIRALT